MLENALTRQQHSRSGTHSFYEALLSLQLKNAACAPSELHAIAARRTLCRAHEPCGAMFAICSGWVACTAILPDGRRQILAFLLPGDLVSTVALFGRGLPYAVQAITDVRYFAVDCAALRARLLADAELFRRFFALWAEEKERADELAIDLGRRSADERIARLILNLMRRLRARNLVHDETFEFPLRQRHIADAAGLTPVHVNRVISEFRQRGLIKTTNRFLTVLKPSDLRRIASMP